MSTQQAQSEQGAAWQLGYPLALLKSRAAPFRSGLKPYCLGPFSLPNEQAVAAAMKRGQYASVDRSGEPAAAALYSKPLRMASHCDFAAREIPIQFGDMVISKLGFCSGGEEAAAELLAQFTHKAPAVWLQLPEEWAEAKAVAEAAGFEYAATKVSAYSEVLGVYVRGDAADERLDSMAPLCDAELPAVACLRSGFLSTAEQDGIIAELDRFAPVWADHYSSYNKRHSWSAFALHGYSPDPDFIIKPSEMSKEWKAANAQRLAGLPTVTTAAEYFPLTLDVAARIPGAKDRVRFMRLAAGHGELARHADITDREAGVANGKVARLHIPIFTNQSVMFRNWDARGREVKTHMAEGGLYYLDQRKPHAAVNLGGFERLHFVLDVRSGPELREMIALGARA